MDRRTFVRTVGLLGTTATVPTASGQEGGDGGTYDTIRVPEDQPTVQGGVDAATAGDLVIVGPGTYREPVTITTPGLTLRGRDRNRVVLDGEFARSHGVLVRADGVAVENLTVRHYEGTAVYWSGVRGFRGSFLTAYNNGYYGLYAFDSRDGRFEYSYASGHPDAGFYLGRNQPYEAVIANVVAEYNSWGYSGTSTGRDLTIRDSVFRHNMAGIVPNTLDSADAPQRASRIVGNVVSDNNNATAPAVRYTYPLLGTGIALFGGSDNRVVGNVVDGHDNVGIGVLHNVVPPSGNVISDNVVRASGVADLALGTPAGEDNLFAANQFATSLPGDIEREASVGAPEVSDVYDEQRERGQGSEIPGGDYRDQPVPDRQPAMRDPEAPPRPASKDGSWEG